MENNIILIGGGGHAIACLDVIENLDSFNVLGYLDVVPTKIDLPYLGNDTEAIKYIDEVSFMICIGQIKNPLPRINAFKYLKSLNAKFATIISPLAYVSKKAKIGEGTIIMHGATVQANVVVGENCIINNRVLIDHCSKVGNNCHISTNVIINGDISIGDNIFIGSGSIIKNGISIGSDTVIGLGSKVLKNISKGDLFY